MEISELSIFDEHISCLRKNHEGQVGKGLIISHRITLEALMNDIQDDFKKRVSQLELTGF